LQKLNLDKDLKDAMIKLARKEKPKPRNPVDPEVMEEDFMTFLDKEKSRSRSSKPIGFIAVLTMCSLQESLAFGGSGTKLPRTLCRDDANEQAVTNLQPSESDQKYFDVAPH
jgi:hypothetical protein